ncbi:Carbon-nitrogen hydrolase [Myotisia sp. PD_48]|nr:Carbon-nitrogen hydrolase [Myotisia sp. PD_48]
MRIATFQLRSKLGEVDGNIRRGDDLLAKLEQKLQKGEKKERLDLLVLPELAFTGYNFPSLKAIRPYFENPESGPSLEWARSAASRLGSVVGVGYPEIYPSQSSISSSGSEDGDQDERGFNSLLFVDEEGKSLLNYRKHFLYYTDEPWAHEGESHQKGQFLFPLSTSRSESRQYLDNRSKLEYRQDLDDPSKSKSEVPISTSTADRDPSRISATCGICMDINPYKFITPPSACEFATLARINGVKLIILSMAWLTVLDSEGLAALKGKPDLDTFQYWMSRFRPLLLPHDGDGDGDGDCSSTDQADEQIIIVFANRAGEEEGSEGKDTARYAGSSCVIGIRRSRPPTRELSDSRGSEAEIVIWDMLGATEEGICFVDTDSVPRMVGKINI